MVKTLLFATLATGIAVATANTYAPQCRPGGDRCKGAANKPAVEWIPCCEGYECTGEDKTYGGYGTLCVPVPEYPAYPTDTPAPKCRAEGDRCKGASGFPAVDWIPCCDGLDCAAADTSYGGYGTLCAPKATYPTEPPAPKCRAEGDRCMGASGYAAVEWIPCCKGFECSADDTSSDGYGKLCAPVKAYTEAPKTTTKAKTTKAPKTTMQKYTTEAPKCVKSGKECDLYGMKCCDGLECTESGKYSYTTSCEPIKVYTTEPPTTTTTAPKCVGAGEKCDEYMACCDYAECKKDDYANMSACVAKTY